MKKRNLITLLFLSLSGSLFAQSLNLNSPLPIDKSTKKGTLPNGMTYYLHRTDVMKNVASYYIIQNVGSVLEKDNQKGLAHFLEHMAFNGTEHFKGKELLNTLEKEGIVFGRDINAYTDFDETVYNINKVPTTPRMIDIGLQALHDWSHYLLLTDEEIDAERGVIKEEWRNRQNGSARASEQVIDANFGHSIYGNRLPIGTMDVIENFKYQTLRDFYHEWYRTDLQAIAIIGDFDMEQMEAKIKSKFSSIPAVKNPSKRFNVKIEDRQELDYAIGLDDETSGTMITFDIRHAIPSSVNTVGDLKERLLDGLLSDILSERLGNLSLKPDAPFLYATCVVADHTRTTENLEVKVMPKDGEKMQQKAFNLAIMELNRAVKFGFTKAEFDRVILKKLSMYKNAIAEISNRDDNFYSYVIKKNFLNNRTITDTEKLFYTVVKPLLNNLTPEDLLKQLQKYYTQKNRVITVISSKSKDNLTKDQALAILKEAENSTTLKPYEEEKASKPLLSGVTLTPGKIIEKKENKNLGFTEYRLSNGVKVYYTFADKNKNKVKLEAKSQGGTSLLPVDDLFNAAAFNDFFQTFGIGEFSNTELTKKLAGKEVESSISLNESSEEINGSSSSNDLETLLQLTNLRFTNPRFDQEDFNLSINNAKQFLKMMSQNINAQQQDSLKVSIYGANNPANKILNEEMLSTLDFEKIKAIYKDRFSNVTDFQFFITGDIQPNQLESLLAQYIASIPSDPSKAKESWKANTRSEWQNKKIDKDVFIEMKVPKTNVNIAFKKPIDYSLKNKYLLTTFARLLSLRYIATLREEEGGIYNSRTEGTLIKNPEEGLLKITFNCNPDLSEKLIKIVHQEIDAICNGKINEQELAKVLTSILKDRKDSENSNSYNMNTTIEFVENGYNRNDPENFENIVKAINSKDVNTFAKDFITKASSYEIVFKPKAK
ncbi:M16 family metallopeptidase [Pedobacter sp. MW01-1-1]|uniref:M16 family metallopeptidase n=1 Tax=Pedobacter sp. MW01-1-1 TaxID=3383027 RepID=UPI003FF0E854